MTPAASAKTKKKEEPPKRRARRRPNPLGRLRTGEAIYLAAAILLFVLMFLDWFGVKGNVGNSLVLFVPFGGGNAWQTLDVIPLFLMLAIVVAVGSALLRISGSDWKPAVPPGAAVCVLGLLAAILILIKIISPPGGRTAEEFAVEPTLKLAVFLALAAALGIAYGGWRAMADEGTSFAAVGKRLEKPSRPKPAAKKKPVASAKLTGPPKSAAKKPASPRRSSRKKP